MLEYSHGEIGWDVFTLEYKVDPPIDTVLDLEATEKYLKLFKHLWQMKRIEKTLDKGWMRVTGGAKTFLRLPGQWCIIIFHYDGFISIQQNCNLNGTKSVLSWSR